MSDVPTDVPVIAPSDHNRRKTRYVCTQCDREVGRENLKVKRVQFREMGFNAPAVKTRTTDWLCVVPADDGGPSCLDKDEDWPRVALASSPGFKDTRLGDGS